MCGARKGTCRRIRAPCPGCRLSWSYSSAVSGPGLRRIASLRPILPMSWSSAPEPKDVELRRAQTHLTSDQHGQGADALGVAGRVRIARVERGRQRANGAEVGGARVRFGRRQPLHQLVERFSERIELAAGAGQMAEDGEDRATRSSSRSRPRADRSDRSASGRATGCRAPRGRRRRTPRCRAPSARRAWRSARRRRSTPAYRSAPGPIRPACGRRTLRR